MKRTGIFALAAGCAVGVTALVGGVGYASALDVAEQSGRTLEVRGVSTVEAGSARVADDSALRPSGEPTDAATDDSSASPSDDDGTADQGSGDAVDEVDPSAPVVIKDDGDPNCRSDNAGERVKRTADREAWLAAEKAEHEAEQAEHAQGDDRSGDDPSDDARRGRDDSGHGSDDSDDHGGWGGRDGGHRGGSDDGGRHGGGRH